MMDILHAICALPEFFVLLCERPRAVILTTLALFVVFFGWLMLWPQPVPQTATAQQQTEPVKEPVKERRITRFVKWMLEKD